MTNSISAQTNDRITHIIATLWQDLPTLFERDISYDIYSQDIFFKDPVNTFKWKFNYRIIFWTLRFHARLFFTEIHFDVHEITHPEPDRIFVTWTVRGTLRVPWRSKLLFNGNSNYTLNEKQQIYRHIDSWDRSPQEILRQFFRPASQPPT
ncbi:DUF2358 domain-containing protein [Microcoleus sp. FACHB-1515]|uniref:DUF2358 domain-containing protein n=1 Tax=Cyanophyceae TaxID=3028117 RepID=UPI0016857583|nr:DUF2358 domain-containing protein [Microcoleus sp. FACHB-1515]MBD2093108.1 DUF2358 domain-containing protein [Microcoleus sp. FACHB-1515]